ncbi:E3 ubiquitin-protein ligase RNFT1-like [Teleopsis dalmanni]|nr:E3 ubiquitin-protein ligase RNFT1-like [Teleopsis dalmanni]
MFLMLPYIGYEMIIGMLLAAFYVGSKMFEIFGRGKSLKKAVVHFVRNADYEHKPTKAEIESAGSICPICHDNYNNPIALECGHIFCDDCVNTWFKREQTCPMCRSKQSEDKTWQDGATSLFYQIF